MQKILDSGLVEAVSFPPVVLCPELVWECMNKYDHAQRCIKGENGEFFLKINWETIFVVMKIPEKEHYEDWTVF